MKIAMLGPTDTVHFRRLVSALVERRHDVHVMSMKPDPVPGATFERYSVPKLGWRFPYGWRGRREAYLRRLFRRFDVVNLHFLSDWGIDEGVASAGRLVVTAYGSDVDHPPETPPPHPSVVTARRRLLRAADCVVSPSRVFAEQVARFGGFGVSSIAVLPFGVDTRLFAPVDRSTNGTGSPVVGYCKGFEPVYGPTVLIEALGHVHAKRPEVRFDLVGDGLRLATCRDRCGALGIDGQITWRDRVEHAYLPEIMGRWDVMAVSSWNESFCVSAIEAAAMGLPVVATDVGGLRESVERDVTGLLVPPGDARALGEALLELLGDRERRFEMGARGRERVERLFAWDACVDRWVELFQRVRDGERGAVPWKEPSPPDEDDVIRVAEPAGA